MSSLEAGSQRQVGKPVRRREDPRLLLGRGQYIADIKRDRQCECVIIRSTHAHAKIIKIDASAALRMPGVLGIFSSVDFPHLLPFPCIDTANDSKPVHQWAIARERVRYIGEPVAVLVAENRYLAEDAAEKMVVEYILLPCVLDEEKASEAGATLLYPEFGTNVVHQIAQRVGDYTGARKTAAVIITEKFKFHRYAAHPLETRGVMAEFARETDTFTIWVNTQFPQFARDFLCRSLNLPPASVRVISPDIGGGFGVKEAIYPEEVLVALVAKKIGRPVRWIEDRREHFSASAHAREETVWAEMIASADGIILGMKLECSSNIGAAYATVGNTPGAVMSAMARMAYRIPHYEAISRSVVTNKTPLNVYRGAGHPQASLTTEGLIDRVGRRLGLDRLEIRRRNFLTPAELPNDRGTAYPGVGPIIYDSGNYPRCFEKLIENLDLVKFPDRQRSARAEGRLLGLGLSCIVEVTSLGPKEMARIRLNLDGTVTLFTGITPIGQGSNTALSQMVAEELQLPLEEILVVHGDTKHVPEAVGTFASRGGSIGGATARLAARKLVRTLREFVAEVMATAIEQVSWKDGSAYCGGGANVNISLQQIARCAESKGLLARLDVTETFLVPGTAYANACHAALVEIDRGTGRVKVVRYGVVHDCGPLINSLIVEGQIMGGVIQGLGGTLNENLIFDIDGQITNATLMDYVMPNIADAPEFVLDHLETPSPHNPFGHKGAGEGGFAGAPAAIVTAIEDALCHLGIEINTSGPFTPDVVLELIERGERDARAVRSDNKVNHSWALKL